MINHLCHMSGRYLVTMIPGRMEMYWGVCWCVPPIWQSFGVSPSDWLCVWEVWRRLRLPWIPSGLPRLSGSWPCMWVGVQCAVGIWHHIGLVGCCAAQQISQTRTDDDLSFRLVAISCMQAFANRRNWQCWYLRCWLQRFHHLRGSRLVHVPKTLAKSDEMTCKQMCVIQMSIVFL